MGIQLGILLSFSINIWLEVKVPDSVNIDRFFLILAIFMVVSTILIFLFADEDEKKAQYFPETVIITSYSKSAFLLILSKNSIFYLEKISEYIQREYPSVPHTRQFNTSIQYKFISSTCHFNKNPLVPHKCVSSTQHIMLISY